MYTDETTMSTKYLVFSVHGNEEERMPGLGTWRKQVSGLVYIIYLIRIDAKRSA